MEHTFTPEALNVRRYIVDEDLYEFKCPHCKKIEYSLEPGDEAKVIYCGGCKGAIMLRHLNYM